MAEAFPEHLRAGSRVAHAAPPRGNPRRDDNAVRGEPTRNASAYNRRARSAISCNIASAWVLRSMLSASTSRALRRSLSHSSRDRLQPRRVARSPAPARRANRRPPERSARAAPRPRRRRNGRRAATPRASRRPAACADHARRSAAPVVRALRDRADAAPRAPSRPRAPPPRRSPRRTARSTAAPARARSPRSRPPCSGSSVSRRQRERIVGGSRPGRCATISTSARGGGSSMVFSSALAPARLRSSAASTSSDAPAARRRARAGTRPAPRARRRRGFR